MASFTEFIGKLGQAGVEASRACEQQATERLKALCDIDEEGNWKPKTVEFDLGGRKVSLPLLVLMAPSRVDVQQLTTSFKTTIQVDKEGSAKMEGHVGLFRRGIEVDTTITFTSDTNVEAIELIREYLNKQLSTSLSDNMEVQQNG